MAYEFRWKNTPNWGSGTVDPTLAFRAGFNFKSTTDDRARQRPVDVEERLDQR